MRTLMKRKKNMETAQIIDNAIKEYYEEKGLPVPQWKMKKNPDWWVYYLAELGIDPNNP
jgi:hypothetical protein